MSIFDAERVLIGVRYQIKDSNISEKVSFYSLEGNDYFLVALKRLRNSLGVSPMIF